MSTYYDQRAQRAAAAAEATRAEADADTRRAQAEATRAETQLRMEQQRLQMAGERAKQERQSRLQATADREARRNKDRLKWRTRRQAAGAGLRAAAGGVRRRVHLLVGAVAIGSPMTIAWSGQLAFGEKVMKLGTLAFTLPVALEGSVLYSAYLTHRALEQDLPTGRYRAMTWTMMTVAAVLNAWHQIDEHATAADRWAGLQVGVIYAIASVVGIVLWELTTGLRKQAKAGRTAAQIRADLWRRMRYPRLSWSAASIQAARPGYGGDPERAWRAAWIDHYGVGPEAPRRERRLTRRIVRRQARADRRAARAGGLSIVGGVIVGRPLPAIAPVDRPAGGVAGVMAAVSIERIDRDDHRPSIDPPAGSGVTSIEPFWIDVEPIDPSGVDRAAHRRSIEPAGRAAIGPRPAPPRRSIEPAKPATGPLNGSVDGSAGGGAAANGRGSSIGARADRSTGARQSIDGPAADRGRQESAPRKSIEEHRAALRQAIDQGRIDPAQANKEDLRRTLKCAPKVSRTLWQEMTQGVLA